MLDFRSLRERLDRIGCTCASEQGFLALADLTTSTCRLICASAHSVNSGAVWPTGTSFWVHVGSDLGFLGLFNGVLFAVPECDSVEPLCLELCERTRHTQDAPLVGLSSDVTTKYQLEEVECLHVALADKRTLQEAREEGANIVISSAEMLGLLKSHIEHVTLSADGRIIVKQGNAQAFTKLCARDHRRASICFVLSGGLRNTDEQVSLLQSIEGALGLPIYDGAWGNRIHLRDPYYQPPSQGFRPSEPSNWISDTAQEGRDSS